MTAGRAAVLGAPIGHSLSPVLHRAGYAALGLDWGYDVVECDQGDLPATLERLAATHRGLSLTMPLKRAVRPLLDRVEPLADVLGAVNTVLYDGPHRLGYNTDVAGLRAALREAGAEAPRAAVVLGGGATATAAVAALGQLGVVAPAVVVRDPARAADLRAAAERLGLAPRLAAWPALDLLATADLVLATVPAGVTDPLGPEVRWAAGAALVDVGYAPWPTRLATAAAAAGTRVVGGLAVLVGQAAVAFELMTGRAAPVAAMRAAGEAALAAR